MTRTEYNLLCKDYGFVIKNDIMAYYKTYVVLMFFPSDNNNGKLNVFEKDGFIEVKNYKDAVKKINVTMEYIKELEYMRKVSIMKHKLQTIEEECV